MKLTKPKTSRNKPETIIIAMDRYKQNSEPVKPVSRKKYRSFVNDWYVKMQQAQQIARGC